MAECEFLAKCPVFDRFRLEGIKNYWIALYCKGDKQDACARKTLKAQGKEVPRTLLPNGMTLDSLAKDPPVSKTG